MTKFVLKFPLFERRRASLFLFYAINTHKRRTSVRAHEFISVYTFRKRSKDRPTVKWPYNFPAAVFRRAHFGAFGCSSCPTCVVGRSIIGRRSGRATTRRSRVTSVSGGASDVRELISI